MVSWQNFTWEMFFLEKPYTKCGWETVLDLPYQKSQSHCSLFLLYFQVKDYHNILKLRWWKLAFTWYKDFLETQSLPGSYFWMIFREEYFSTCILLTNQISVPDSLYFLRYCAIWVCFAFYEVTNFEIMLSFLTKPCDYITKKVRTKI